MKSKLFRFHFYFLIALIAFVSCDSGLDDVELPNENKYLVESELVNSFSEVDISTYLTLAILAYPEQQEALEAIKNQVQTGVEVHKVIYNTQFDGTDILASGIVCLPNESGNYPILSYQNGTNTLHSAAPSVDTDNQLFQILQMMGSTGFIISMPDYLGFGESDDMFHPYLHEESTVQTVTDMLRAVEEMLAEDENSDWNGNVYLSGYSQGGWATMALQKAIETKHAAEFILKASACGAGPYNLLTITENVTELDEYPMPYFLGYIYNSYINLGLTTPITEVFNEPYASRILGLYDGSKSGNEINAQLTNSISGLFTADYLSGWNSDSKFAGVKEMLEVNSISAYNTKIPTMILHGTADNFVTPEVSTNMYNDFLTAGVSTNLIAHVQLEGEDHTSGIVPSGLTSLLWFLELKGVVL